MTASEKMNAVKSSLMETFNAEKASFQISNETLGQLARLLPHCSGQAQSYFIRGDFYSFLSFVIADYKHAVQNLSDDFFEIFDTIEIPKGITIGNNHLRLFDFCDSFGICVKTEVRKDFGNGIPIRVELHNGEILE